MIHQISVTRLFDIRVIATIGKVILEQFNNKNTIGKLVYYLRDILFSEKTVSLSYIHLWVLELWRYCFYWINGGRMPLDDELECNFKVKWNRRFVQLRQISTITMIHVNPEVRKMCDELVAYLPISNDLFELSMNFYNSKLIHDDNRELADVLGTVCYMAYLDEKDSMDNEGVSLNNDPMRSCSTFVHKFFVVMGPRLNVDVAIKYMLENKSKKYNPWLEMIHIDLLLPLHSTGKLKRVQ